MNPWNAIGWLLFFLLAIFCLWIMGGLIITAFLEAKKKRLSKKKPNILQMKGEIGEKIHIVGRDWRVDMIKTDYDIEFDKDRVRLDISSRRGL